MKLATLVEVQMLKLFIAMVLLTVSPVRRGLKTKGNHRGGFDMEI
jgi:hypothetical protein